MAWHCSGTTNASLVANLRQHDIIRSERVANAFLQVDRGDFLRQGGRPYEDSPQLLGWQATISAPHMHAECTEALLDFLQPDMHALDIGSGSGYLSAIFACLVGARGRVTGLEHIPELVQHSRRAVRKHHAHLLDHGILTLEEGDCLALPSDRFAPDSLDAIHVGAAASAIPPAWFTWLRAPGRLIVPVGKADGDQILECWTKDAHGHLSQEALMGVRYVPLCTKSEQMSR
jgi:protein-L-isoaspartate(D-aspartate) O-methyltransferase